MLAGIDQTANNAILNWETVDFQQYPSWAVLNRVNDPAARASQIEGQIKADGTVLILNRNGVLFSGTSPVHIYAGGDIVNVTLGYAWDTVAGFQAYAPLKAVEERAGGDIVNEGLGIDPANHNQTAAGWIMNYNDTHVSVIQAGGNTVYTNLNVAGPGTLVVRAGGNLYQANRASIASTGLFGNAVTADPSAGSSIALLAGVGPNGPDYTNFAKLYFNNANVAASAIPDTDPANAGKVPATYEDALYAWLRQRFAYTGSEADALTDFLTLPSEQRAYSCGRSSIKSSMPEAFSSMTPRASAIRAICAGAMRSRRSCLTRIFPVIPSATAATSRSLAPRACRPSLAAASRPWRPAVKRSWASRGQIRPARQG